MPVYQYEGKHYDLPDGLSNEQAISKIQSYLGKSVSQPTPTSKENTLYTEETIYSPEGIPISTVPYGAQTTGATKTAEQILSGIVSAPVTAGISMVRQPIAIAQPVAKLLGSKVADEALKTSEMIQSGMTEAAGPASWATTRPASLLGEIAGPVGIKAAQTVGGALKGKGLLTQSAATGATLGLLEPTTSEDYLGAKAVQAGVGAVLGPLTEYGIKALGGISNIAKGLTAEGRTQATREYLDKLVGTEKTQVIEALRNAQEIITGSKPTVAEAIANIPTSTELAAAQRALEGKSGVAGMFKTREAEQQAARLAQIQEISGTPAERVALKEQRGIVTNPMREQALEQADMAGPIVSKLEKGIGDKYNSLVEAERTAGEIGNVAAKQQAVALEGKPSFLTAGQIASEAQQTSALYKDLASQKRAELKLKQFQLQSLEDNGFFPLKAQDVTDQINSAIRGATKDEVKAILQATKDKIIGKADANGIISSRDLYENVRQSLNRDISGYMAQAGKPFMGGLPEAEAKTASNVKQFIDSALNKSSEGLWTKYLDKYVDYSRKLDRMDIGQALADKLGTPLANKERAGVFANAVQEATTLIKKSTGLPRYENLSKILTSEENIAVNKVLADLQRKAKSEELASGIKNLPEGYPNVTEQIPSLLSRTMTIAKSAINYLHQGKQADFDKKVAELMLDPKSMAVFIDAIPKNANTNNLVSAMVKGMSPETRRAFEQMVLIAPFAAEVGK
jgi:hypothetical protein